MQPLKEDFMAEEIKTLKCAQTCMYRRGYKGSKELSFFFLFSRLGLKAEAHENPEPSTPLT